MFLRFSAVDAFEAHKTNGQPFSHFELNLSRGSDGNRVRYNCAAEMNGNWWHNGDKFATFIFLNHLGVSPNIRLVCKKFFFYVIFNFKYYEFVFDLFLIY